MDDKDESVKGPIIKSDNTEGNPWHSGKDGQFTSPENAKGALSKEDLLKLSEDELHEYYKSAIKMPKKSAEDKMAHKEKMQLKSYFAKNTYYDKNKISQATLDDLKQLNEAEVEVKNEELELSSSQELIDLNKGGISGPWKEVVYPSDYEKLLKQGNFEKKKDYFEHIFQGSEEKKQEMLSLLEEFKTKGEKYIAKQNEIRDKYDSYHKLIESYQDSDTYSQTRKDNALWFDDMSMTEKALAQKSSQYLKTLAENDHEAYVEIKAYTGSYHRVNEPLRGVNYTGSMGEKEQFVDRVNAISRAIDSAPPLEQDMWIRRGCSQLRVENVDGIGYLLGVGAVSSQDLEALVGTTFVDQGFVSARASKDIGAFGTGAKVQMFIYCPKGTKGAYIAPESSFYYENEMLLQRGYQYRITKAYKKGTQICVDCEVLLGTDASRYDNIKLQELAEKHYKN